MSNHSLPPGGLTLSVPPALVGAIAAAVADELERRGTTPAASASPYLDVDEAAAYLRCTRQRVYDVVHAGAIEPAPDGRRLLFRREALNAYLDDAR
jgi:excisionase family DNA binding protein